MQLRGLGGCMIKYWDWGEGYACKYLRIGGKVTLKPLFFTLKLSIFMGMMPFLQDLTGILLTRFQLGCCQVKTLGLTTKS